MILSNPLSVKEIVYNFRVPTNRIDFELVKQEFKIDSLNLKRLILSTRLHPVP